MQQLSQVFKALSEPLRLRIIRQLLTNGREAYGEELAGALGIPPYQLSRHLKVLTATGLVTERREGRWVYYSLAKNHGHGQVLVSLRPLLTHAKPPRRRKMRRARQALAPEQVNWNNGPAIPGML
ncbi:MAG: helix-turn-helix transcriptional regulator [Candidatus Omnitrophica bacterium]|nr:helix-turn-helix transcriptional regulator [Candidatus Omnitrophota bacterium]